jgi:hypothetical protein
MSRRVLSNWVTGLNDYNLQKIRFNASDVQAIHQARQMGKSYTQLTAEFRCCRFTIGRVLNYQGVYRQYRESCLR